MLSLIKSVQERDGNAKPGFLHVLLTCSGVHAVLVHRLSHWLWKHKVKLLAQILSGFMRFLTGIEIHPQAQIGRFLYIDHGIGVVIGQTAIIGDNVTMYHGVTLGGKGAVEAGKKRHPTIEDNSVIGAGAQVLGDITIGKGGKVGANAVVTKNVPAGYTAVGNPARLLTCKDDDGQAYGMPREWIDPVTEAIDGLLKDVEELKAKVGDCENSKNTDGETYADHWKESRG